MSRSRRSRAAGVMAFLLISVACHGCGRSGDAIAALRVAAAPAAANKDCWWYRPSPDALAAVWLSPVIDQEVPGGFRFVNLFFHDTQCDRPMALSGTVVRASDSHPVAITNPSMRFTVAPHGGKTWDQVVGKDDLEVVIERL